MKEGRPPSATPSSRPMTPAVILRELSQIQIGDIQLETTDGRRLSLRRVSRPTAEQARILTALNLNHRRRVLIRQAEELFRLFPSPSAASEPI